MLDEMSERVNRSQSEFDGLNERVAAANASLQLAGVEAEAYAAMTKQLLGQLESGAASVLQVMRDFNVQMNATYIPGMEDLGSKLAKRLGEIQQFSQELASMSGDFAAGDIALDALLGKIGQGNEAVKQLIEDILQTSRDATEVEKKLNELREVWANKNKGGSALDSALREIQQAALAGDLADVIGSGLGGGRF